MDISKYNANNIQILNGLEAVRKRPGMYIGNTTIQGLHHMIYEIVDNSVDEALSGYCNIIKIFINKNNSITVVDNGRGIPIDINNKIGISGVEIIFTMLHSGGKFNKECGYKISGGLHGVGASVVNALSIWLEVIIYHNGKIYFQRYEKGKTVSKLNMIGKYNNKKNGTIINFLPDNTIFEKIYFDFDILKCRFREISFLTEKLKIIIIDNKNKKKMFFKTTGGIKNFVQYLNNNKILLYENIIYIKDKQNKIYVEIAIQHNKLYTENIYSFVNNINTKNGGTHVIGFKNALTKVFNDYAKKNKIFKKYDQNIVGEDIKDGLVAIINIKLPNPQFEGQTKYKLSNSKVRWIVYNIVSEKIKIFFEQNPYIAKKIIEKALISQRAKNAIKKIKDLNKKNTFDWILPGKLSDCINKDTKKREIYIVEGDSAGGSAKAARNRETQAILPLRGKILNVEKANFNKIYANTEIKSMITAFGTGVKENFNINKLRYNKIIIMTDADVDGAHISTLLLTFLYRFMPDLIKNGHIYIARPPLFKIKKNKKIFYAYSEKEHNKILNIIGYNNVKIQRYKGLGEMNSKQLWETTMNPKNRILLKVVINNKMLYKIDLMFSILMGNKVEPRRKFIEKMSKYATNIDI